MNTETTETKDAIEALPEVEAVVGEIVGGPKIVNLRSPPIEAGRTSQIRYVAEASCRLVGVRCADGGTVTGLLTDKIDRGRRSDDVRTWAEILRDPPFPLAKGTALILAVRNTTPDKRVFEAEIEVLPDESVPARASSGSAAQSASSPAPQIVAGSALPGMLADLPQVASNGPVVIGSPTVIAGPSAAVPISVSGSEVQVQRGPTLGVGETFVPRDVLVRGDADPVHVVLDRSTAAALEGWLLRRQPLDLGRVVAAVRDARLRIEMPTVFAGWIVASLPNALVVRLDAALRRGVALGREDGVQVVEAIRKGLQPRVASPSPSSAAAPSASASSPSASVTPSPTPPSRVEAASSPASSRTAGVPTELWAIVAAGLPFVTATNRQHLESLMESTMRAEPDRRGLPPDARIVGPYLLAQSERQAGSS